MYTLYLKDI